MKTAKHKCYIVLTFVLSFFLIQGLQGQSFVDRVRSIIGWGSNDTEIKIDEKKFQDLMGQVSELQRKISKGRDSIVFLQLKVSEIEKKYFNTVGFSMDESDEWSDLMNNPDSNSIFGRRIRDLKQNLSSLKSEIAKNEEIIRINNITIDDLEDSLLEKQQRIAQLNREIRNLNDELSKVEQVIICVQQFNSERRQNRLSARKEIDRAVNIYESFIRNQGRYYETDRVSEDTLLIAWLTFEKYGAVSCDSSLCSVSGIPPLQMNYCDDYLTGYENYLAARIIAYNPSIVLNLLSDTLKINEKFNYLNEVLLRNIGASLDKGVYNVRSDAKAIVEDLPRIMQELPAFVIEERKSSENTDVRSDLIEIVRAYNREEFDYALYLYGKYERLFAFEDFKEGDYPKLILLAKYCAGTILLWDLGNVENAKKLAFPYSWTGQNLNFNFNAGISLLNQVIQELTSTAPKEQEEWQKTLLKKTHIALSKRGN